MAKRRSPKAILVVVSGADVAIIANVGKKKGKKKKVKILFEGEFLVTQLTGLLDTERPGPLFKDK